MMKHEKEKNITFFAISVHNLLDVLIYDFISKIIFVLCQKVNCTLSI